VGFALIFLVRVGLIRVLELSKKGRLTQFVERQEPQIRAKLCRHKWFPPILIALDPTTPPNAALATQFSKRLFYIDRANQSWLARSIRQSLEAMLRGPVAPFRLFKRSGSPWEMRLYSRDKDGSYETDQLLDLMQIERQSPIALLSVRDEVYHAAIRQQHGEDAGPETDQDTSVRNPDLVSYLTAVMKLKAIGYTVVYFGFPAQPLASCLSKIVIDYSGSFREPRRDLLLGKRCNIMLCGSSGAWAFASLFNHPVAFSNTYVPFLSGYSTRDSFIPQLLWNERENRLLTFQEMIKTEWQYSYKSNCDRDRIRLVKNSPEEIADHALEVVARIQKSFVSHPEDKDLHCRFNQIRSESKLKQSPGQISTIFLRKFAHLLV